jgi:hypothetical protein
MGMRTPLDGIEFVKLQDLDPGGERFSLTECGLSNPRLPKTYVDPTLDKNTYWGPAL